MIGGGFEARKAERTLQQRRKRPQTGDEFIQRLPLQGFKVLVNGLAWIVKSFSVRLG